MEYDNENLAKHEIMKIRIQDERPGKSRNKMRSRFPLSLPQVPIFSSYHTIPSVTAYFYAAHYLSNTCL